MAELGNLKYCMQIADTAFKLKRLWSEIKDGPRDVEELVQEILVHAEALKDLHEFHQKADNINMQHSGWDNCLLLFRSSAEAFERATKDLDAILSKHKRTGAVRIFLKKDTMTRCKERFQRVQMMMITSQQTYFSLFASRNFSMILNEIQTVKQQQKQQKQQQQQQQQQQQPVSQAVGNDTGTANYHTTAQIDAPRQSQMQVQSDLHRQNRTLSRPLRRAVRASSYRLQLPTWILRRGLQITTHSSHTSWGMTLRTYNRLGPNSPVFVAAEKGDWATVQTLFASRQASPFDLDPCGTNLLCFAAQRFEVDACRMLMDHGLTPSDSFESYHRTAVEYLAWGSELYESTSDTVTRANETISLFASAAIESFISSRGTLLDIFLDCPVALLATIIQTVFVDYEAVDPQLRAHMALSSGPSDFTRIELLLGPNLSLSRAFELTASTGGLANHFRSLFVVSEAFGRLSDHDQNQGFIKYLSEIIAFDHQCLIARQYHSTLISFLFYYFQVNGWHPASHGPGMYNQHVSQIARLWIKLLETAGADLERYFVAEQAAISHLQCTRHCQIESRDSHGRDIILGVQSICRGTSGHDWSVFVTPKSSNFGIFDPGSGGWISVDIGHTEYEMAGAFWNWVENPELFNIPGSFYDIEDEWPAWSPVVLQGPIL